MTPLTMKQAQVILALAECDMSSSQAAHVLHHHQNAVYYHIQKIRERTGLDPKCFYDLCKLVDMARKDKSIEVPRCHECQSHTEDPETGKHYCWKPLGCMGCVQVNPDDFCSRGKKKSGEG